LLNQGDRKFMLPFDNIRPLWVKIVLNSSFVLDYQSATFCDFSFIYSV